jgi:hypothetical protein
LRPALKGSGFEISNSTQRGANSAPAIQERGNRK